MRKAAVAVTAVVLLLAGTALLVPRLVPLDSYRPRILAALEEKTGRKGSLDRISLTLLPAPGLRLGGLSVAGDAGHEAEPLLAVREGEVRLALLPLLSGRVVLSKVLLDRPAIVFRRYPDGTHSLTETLRRLATADGKGEGGEPREGKGSSLSVAVTSLRVSGASVSLRDADGKGGERRLDLSPVNLSLSGLGAKEGSFAGDVLLSGALRGKVSAEGTFRPAPAAEGSPSATAFSGKGSLFGQDVAFEGSRVPAGAGEEAETELSLALPSLDLARLADPFASPPPPLVSLRPSGKASLSVRLSGSPSSLGIEAEGDLTSAGWTVRPGLGKAPGEPCTVVVQGRRFPDRLVLSNGELRLPPLLVVANGSLSPPSGGREWALHGRIEDLSAFSRNRGGALAPYSPEGRVVVQGRGRRLAREAREDFTVDADLSAVAFRLPGRPVELRDVGGHVTLLPEAVRFEPLGGLLNGQRFRAAGQVALAGGTRGDLDLRMAYLDLDALLSALAAGRQEKGKGGEAEAPAAATGGAPGARAPSGEGGEARGAWSVTARVAVDAGRAKGIDFTDLVGTVRAVPGRYDFSNAGMKAFDGSVTADGWARTGGAERAFQARISLRDVSTDRVLSWRSPSLKGYVEGRGNLSADLSGSLEGGDSLARTLAGKGRLALSGAKVRGFNLVGSATGAAGLPPLPGLPAPSVPETALSDLSADFTVSGGKVRTENLVLTSGKASFAGAGAIGLDRTIDVSGSLRLPPGAAAKSLGRFVLTAGGVLELPVRVHGPLADPDVSVDLASVAKGAAAKAVRGLVDAIPGAAPSPAPPPAGGGDGSEPPPPRESETGKVLKGLFDRIVPKR